MKKLLPLLMVLALGVFSFTACEHNGGSETTRSGENKAKLTDSELETAIKAKINSDTRLNAAGLSVSADADDNTATLSGTVETQDLRTKALALAKEAHSGLIITDKIDVKPREITRETYTDEMATRERAQAKEVGDTVGDSLDDAWIHTKIVAKLIGNSSTPERKINVDVKNNIVTLRGTVDAAEQKAEAGRVAQGTEGVKRVINQLKVVKPANG